jgi:hypothetical protein
MRGNWLKLAAAAVIVAAGFYAADRITEARSPTVVLPGGGKLSLLAVNMATNYYVPGGPLDKLFQRFFPGKSFRRGSLNFGPANPMRGRLVNNSYGIDDGTSHTNHAAVWLRETPATRPIQGAADSFGQDFRVVVADEQGNEWDAGKSTPWWAPLHTYTIGALPTDRTNVWHFHSFPRRGKRIRVKIYSGGVSNHWDLLADFKAPNPALGSYPVWNAMPMPATVTNGDLSVTLVKLVSAPENLVNIGGGGLRACTTAIFRVQQNGWPTTSWRPGWMEAKDATGNEEGGLIQRYSIGETNGLVFVTEVGDMSQSEVWRLKIPFSDPDESREFEFLARPTRE